MIRRYGLQSDFDIVRSISVEQALADPDALSGVQVVFMSGVHSHERNILLKQCVDRGIISYIIPRLGDVIMSGAVKQPLCHLPMLRVERYNPKPEFLIAKRCFDVGFSVLLLLLTALPMAVFALLIRRDGGPVIYQQTRITKDGRRFQLLKFRSMRVDA